jgi:type VI secretion system protein ImpK
MLAAPLLNAAEFLDEESQPRANESLPLGNLVTQVVVSRATELARLGRYDDAESLLEALLPAGVPIAALDLLARMRAQQGRLAEAKALWRQVSQLKPGDSAAEAALARIARIERKTPLQRGAENSGNLPQSATSQHWGQPDPGSTSSAGSMQLRLHVPGVVLQETGDEVVASFDFKLFCGAGAELDKKGQTALSALGWQLEPYVGRIALEVVGQPDTLPPDSEALPRDVSAVGMARAAAVFNPLIETTKLQARMFSLRTGEDFLLANSSEGLDDNTSHSAIQIRISRIEPCQDTTAE